MSIVATIRGHSGRLYRGIQLLLAIAIGAAALAIYPHAANISPVTALIVSIVATSLALATLMYMRSTVVHSLKSAAAAEAEKIRFLTTDTLTGSMTRRYFLQALQDRLRSKADTALILLDLDHFKQLNDSFGHQFGDFALTQLVATATQRFGEGSVGRLGGDEFGIIVPHADETDINRHLQHLLKAVQGGKPYEGKIIPLSFSAGVALAPAHASNPTELMLLADLALYESKAKGRGRATLFDEEMQSDQRYRRLVERELRAAVYLNELELHYQPIVDADGSTFALEGLIRWRHPVRGIVSPAEFIPIAERSTLIDMVGEWVFKRACADLDHFPGKRLSINVSGEQLKRDAVVTMFERILRESGRSASQFVIEITETSADQPVVAERMERIRRLGVRVAIDDFGAGYSSLGRLHDLPIDFVKLDRSFVADMGLTDNRSAMVVGAAVQLAHGLGARVVAEGIERPEQAAAVAEVGCDYIQGFLLSKPVPAAEVAKLWRSGDTRHWRTDQSLNETTAVTGRWSEA